MRQLFSRHCDTNCVARWIGELTQPIEESKRLQNCRVDADTDRCIPPLDPLQCWPAGEGPFRDHPRGQPPTPARIADVLPKLAKSAADGNGRTVRGGHGCNLRVSLNGHSVTRSLHFSLQRGARQAQPLVNPPMRRDPPLRRQSSMRDCERSQVFDVAGHGARCFRTQCRPTQRKSCLRRDSAVPYRATAARRPVPPSCTSLPFPSTQPGRTSDIRMRPCKLPPTHSRLPTSA